MRRVAGAVVLAALWLGLGAAMAAGRTEQASRPSFVLDRRGDARGPLDVVRVALGPRSRGRLRGEVTMRRRWDTGDLGSRGSVCVKLYLRADPDAEPPEYLVCATAAAEGERLRGRVLRNRANGLPRTVATASATRPTRRAVHLRFARSAIRRPGRVKFAGEALTRGTGCPSPTGCVDLGPDAPGTRTLRLHP